MRCATSSEQSKGINSGSDKGLRSGESKMKTRKLGSLEVSELGAGCMSISANYGPPADRNQGIQVLRAAQMRARSWESASSHGVQLEWVI